MEPRLRRGPRKAEGPGDRSRAFPTRTLVSELETVALDQRPRHSPSQRPLQGALGPVWLPGQLLVEPFHDLLLREFPCVTAGNEDLNPL